MSQPQPPLDERGEAREALNSAVASYGPRILQNPQMLGNVVTDLLPDLPREQTLLIAAAEAGVATDLSQHVRDQNIDSGTAVQLAARALTDKKAIDPAASMWVTTEYARALGYDVPAYVSQPVPSSGAPPIPASAPISVPPPLPAPPSAAQSAPPAQQPAPPWPGQSFPPLGQSVPPSAAQSVPPWSAPPQNTLSFTDPSASPYGGGGHGTAGGPWAGPGGPYPPGGPPPTRPDSNKRRNRTILVAAAAVVGVLIIYVIAAAATHIAPFSRTAAAKPTAPPTSHAARPASPRPAPSHSPTLPPNVADLKQMLPGDLGGTATQCQSQSPPYNWKMPDLVQAMTCSDPNLPGGTVYAYQMDSPADFLTAWQNFDRWWGFDPGTAQNACPPTGNGQGTSSFKNNWFPSTDNQVVQCAWVGQKGDTPAYAWAFPTEYTFFLAVGAEGSAFSDLDNWWKNNSLPTASPSPAGS